MKLPSLAALALLTACGTSVPVPKSPDQVLFAAKTAYAAALTIVDTYGALPKCGSPVKLPCHDAALLVQAQDAKNAAKKQIAYADAAVVAYGVITSPTASDTAKAMASVTAARNVISAVESLGNQTKGAN